MTADDVMAIAITAWLAEQVTRHALAYRTARRRDAIKAQKQP